MEFKAFPKIPRWSLAATVIVTEKIDGTNACVVISPEGEVTAQSRTRIITPEADNFGFASWVKAHESELVGLGPGYHFGEWWGLGIQRGYGLTEKRFSLFNVGRWSTERPACCHVVPLVTVTTIEDLKSEPLIADLKARGSVAVPGYMNPEGLCFWIGSTGHYFKKLCENDNRHKSQLA